MKKLLYLIIAIAVVTGAVWLLTKVPPQVSTKISSTEKDTVLEGNQTINASEKIVVKNGAKLTVNGDLTIKGALECENGPLNLAINGNLVVDKNITCNRSDNDIKSGDPGIGISIAVSGSTIFNKNAVVTSNSHVQITDSAGKIARTSEQLEKIFDGVEVDSGIKPRIGPFVLKDSKNLLLGMPVAHAQGIPILLCIDSAGKIIPNCVKIGGKWIIGGGENPPPGIMVSTPPKGVKKIILNFDFGPNHNFYIEDFSLAGPDGRPGQNDVNNSCNAKGGNGEDAFRVKISAGNITINFFELWLGDGGMGGKAETTKNCDPGLATGGNGGKPGNLKIEAADKLKIIGAFLIHPGYGGDGGRATANGRDGANGCPAQKGGDATAKGGNGSDNKKDLKALGNITGLANVVVSPTRGGHGGEGIANPGKGGNGAGCGCKGGDGGKGTAIGGKGGNANLIVLGTPVKTTGGNGGNADSYGGLGGNGGMCNAEGAGGNGGKGGDASSAKGVHGTGKTNGDDGRIIKETGGNGGNGGDGCPEGKEGPGGKGNPNGKSGLPGKNLCPMPSPIPQEMIQMQLRGGEVTPPSNQPPTTPPPPPSYYQ